MSQLTPSSVRSFNPGATVFIATGRHTVKAELTGELQRNSYYISDMQRFAEFCFREGYDLAGKFAPVVGEPCGCFEDFVCKTHRQERKYYDIALAEGEGPSVTALIPAFVGIPILLLGMLALKEPLRMHAMHAVSILALIGFLLPAGRLAMQVAKGAETKAAPLASLILMAVLCGGLLFFCVKSFIDARRRRSQPGDG